MLKAEHISSLFDRLFTGDKHLGEAKLRRTLAAAHTLGGNLVMLVATWCHAGGQMPSLNAGEFSLCWQEPGWAPAALGHLPAVEQGRAPAG